MSVFLARVPPQQDVFDPARDVLPRRARQTGEGLGVDEKAKRMLEQPAVEIELPQRPALRVEGPALLEVPGERRVPLEGIRKRRLSLEEKCPHERLAIGPDARMRSLRERPQRVARQLVEHLPVAHGDPGLMVRPGKQIMQDCLVLEDHQCRNVARIGQIGFERDPP